MGFCWLLLSLFLMYETMTGGLKGLEAKRDSLGVVGTLNDYLDILKFLTTLG